MKKILVIGAFGYGCNQLDGQTIKTRSVYQLIKQRHDGKLAYIDTLELKKKPWIGFRMLYLLATCNTLILLPCLNNLTLLFPIFFYMSTLCRFNIVSICIGGWQVEYFMGDEKFGAHPKQMKMSKKIKGFLPEMEKVNTDLIKQCGFTNTEVFPNFRKYTRDDQIITNEKGLRLVFMARVTKLKGYDVIFDSLEFIRKNCPNTTVDFYGWMSEEDKEDFLAKVEANKDIVKYKGLLSPDKIHSTLLNYDLMLLPTKYYTEGFPGTVLDSYIAGIPVIVSEWKHSHEFVNNGVTGIIVPFENNQIYFNEAIFKLYKDRDMLTRMKYAAYQEAEKYSEDAAWYVLQKYL